MENEEKSGNPFIVFLGVMVVLAFLIVLGFGMAYIVQPPSPELLIAQAQADSIQREANERIRIEREKVQASKPVQVQVAEIEASKMSTGEGIVATGAVVGGVWLLGKMLDSI